MIEFRVLGSLDLRGPEGEEILSVLSQPKRVALLAYLSVAAPRGFHRRDKLLGLFWPESDQEHARSSLRVALHHLRGSLGEDVLLGRGDGEVGLNWELVQADVVGFEGALVTDPEQALTLYRGHLLEGFFLSDCPGFERWLDEERERLKEAAAGAAWTVAHKLIAGGELTGAERMGQRALSLVATDENEVRRFVEALAAAGDRAAAVRFYEKFAHKLEEELDLSPDAESQELLERIRASEGRQVPLGPEETAPRWGQPSGSAAPAQGRIAQAPAPTAPAGVRGLRGRTKAMLYGGAILLALAAMAVATRFWPTGRPGPGQELMAVFPFENLTGNEHLDDLGSLVARSITNGLSQSPEVGIIDPQFVAQAMQFREPGVTNRQLAADFGAARFITGEIISLGDSTLRIQAQVSETETGQNLSSAAAEGAEEERLKVIEALRQRVMTALEVAQDEYHRGLSLTLPTYEAWQIYNRGLVSHFEDDFLRAYPLFLEAYETDTTFVDGLVAVVVNAGRAGQWGLLDSLLTVIEPRRDRLTPWLLNWVDYNQQRLEGDLEGMLGLWRAEYERNPSQSWNGLQVAQAAIQLGRPEQAVRALRDYDPAHPLARPYRVTWYTPAQAHFFAGDLEKSLESALHGLERFPRDLRLRGFQIRALARMGRTGDAEPILADIETMGPDAGSAPGSVLLQTSGDLARLGSPDLSLRAAEGALRWFASRGSAAHQEERARGLLLTDKIEEARDLLHSLTEDSPDSLSVRGLLGIALARTGNRAGAEVQADWVAEVERPYLHGSQWYWRAAILAHLGRREEAVDLLRRSHREGRTWDSLQADALLSPLWGFEPFERFISPKG